MGLVALFVFAGILGIIPAMIASKKGRYAGAWWLYGTLLFIIALPHSLLLEPWQEFTEKRAERKCPFCAELIKAEAKVCRYCNRDVPVVQRIDLSAPTDFLLEQLRSADPKVREQAIIALGYLGAASRDAEPALRALLKDPVRDIRSRAKWALETIARESRR
jgi:hypothetical protein